jgi:hypothetical protein
VRENPADEGVEEGLGDLEIVAPEDGPGIGRLERRPHRPVRDAAAELAAEILHGLAEAAVRKVQALDRDPTDARPVPVLEAPPHLAGELAQPGLVIVQGAADGVGPLGRDGGEVHGRHGISGGRRHRSTVISRFGVR